MKSTPQKIGKYLIERPLGSGAMGVVYKAHDEQIERPVAIKILHEHLRRGANGSELAARFLQEARAAARCLHPNIVTIFDFGDEGGPFIVMEYVEGVDLRAYLKAENRVPLPAAVSITAQVLQALEHAHSRGVVHRDIKPDNIILLTSGAVKVSDFGVARLETSDLTGTGYMVGTPNYMSPEGLQARHVDARSDLFSVGVVLFELVANQRMNRDLSLKENLNALKSDKSLTGNVFTQLHDVLSRALQSDAEQRFQSAAEFLGQLKQLPTSDPQATVVLMPHAYSSPPAEAPGRGDASLDNDALAALERSLATYVGPMAKLLVKKGLRTAQSFEDLVEHLLQHIPTEQERQQFRLRVQRSGATSFYPAGGGIKPVSSMQPPPVSITPTQQAALTELLAFYTGPIAQRLVRKYLPQCRDFTQLVEACGRHILHPQERQQFLDRANRS